MPINDKVLIVNTYYMSYTYTPMHGTPEVAAASASNIAGELAL